MARCIGATWPCHKNRIPLNNENAKNKLLMKNHNYACLAGSNGLASNLKTNKKTN